MSFSRRDFIKFLTVASAAGINIAGISNSQAKGSIKKITTPGDMYEVPKFGNVSLLHYTDCHGQLLPVYFREPSINLGVSQMEGKAPHVVGKHLLQKFGIKPGSPEAHAFTYLDFTESAHTFGKAGGFAHLATLVKSLREQRPGALLLDGGDTWGGGSATGIWTNAQDMVDAQLLLGVDVMTGHWEFTFGADRVREIVENDFKGKIDFVAQNVVDKDFEDPVFKPYTLKEINGIPVAIIGQAFPYTPIANPAYMVPDWSFGIREERMQEVVDKARNEGAQIVVVLSHNGMDVDLKMASRIIGIDAILGGHTHDAVPAAIEVANSKGKTLVINSGSNGKFLGVLDLDVRGGRLRDYRFKLLPVFANMIPADPQMQQYIDKVRAPYLDKLNEKLAITDALLYRRGNFNGTFDQIICDALVETQDAEIAFSPGFRWGVSVLPGEAITYEEVMSQTALTYPIVTRNPMKGEYIKLVLEDIADNIFNEDPYYQQGGDMVRIGELKYSIDPRAKIGHRIKNMELKGKPVDANKEYIVAGWASIMPDLEGKPIWDVVSDYLRDKKTVSIKELNVPKIIGMDNNPGLAYN